MKVIPLYSGKYHIDLILRLGSFWIGCHYSKKGQSICIGIPIIVVRIGKTVYRKEEA